VPGLRVSELIVAGLAALLLATVETRRVRPWTLFDWTALAYCAATLVLGGAALLDRGVPVTLEAASTLVGPFQFLLLYRAVLAVVRTEAERRRALALVLLAAVPVSLLALLQFAGIGGLGSTLSSLTGAEGLVVHSEEVGIEHRTTGVFPHWQMLAGYLFVVVVTGLGALLAPGRGPLPRWLTCAVTLLALAAMISTGTFVTAFGVLAAALVLGAWYGRLGRVVAGLAVVAAGVAALFGSLVAERVAFSFGAAPGADREAFVPQSIAYRFELWTEELLPAIAGRWVTGWGPDLPSSLSFEHTESMYLTLLFRGGIPLLLVYAALTLALAGAAWRLAARAARPFDRMLGRAMFTLVALLVVLHLLEPYFVTTGLPHLIWILAALVLSGLHDVRERAP
jgi:O-antigen ligase